MPFQVAMDWYTWLSKTNLEQTLVYEYGLAFVRNELQEEDLAYFNHEFLQSVGISIAKHRLEIIKLARKDIRGTYTTSINGLSTRLVHAVNKTRKLFTKSIIGKKWGSTTAVLHSSKNPSLYPVSEVVLSPYRNQWSGALKRLNNGGNEKEKSSDQKKAVISRRRNVMWSGPLDKRMQEKLMMTHSVSGPLDGKNMYPRSPNITGPMKDQKLGFICRSPTIPGPTMDKWAMSPLKMNYYSSEKVVDIDEDGTAQSLWSLMFQDMKPT